ncbi:MAG: nucleoside-triphosphatase [Bacillota bacterium]|nr:nucleoside-triphosphatase [Bacillota bacterium]
MKRHPFHLFIEGPSRTGKSTLLRQMLAPYMDHVGGFASQRLLDDDGNTVAFRIGSAATTPLTAPFSEAEKPDGIFRITHPDGTTEKFPEVFDRDGIAYLTQTRNKKLILLDEIGGAELLSAPFRGALARVLSGSIPCIGVIKLPEKARFMSRTAGYAKTVVEYNKDLRRKLQETHNAKVLYFDRDAGDESTAEVKKEIEEFLCGIFTTS